MFDDGFCLGVLASDVASEDRELVFTVGIFDVENPWYVTGLNEVECCGLNGCCQDSEWILLDESAERGNRGLRVGGAKIHDEGMCVLNTFHKMESK